MYFPEKEPFYKTAVCVPKEWSNLQVNSIIGLAIDIRKVFKARSQGANTWTLKATISANQETLDSLQVCCEQKILNYQCKN